MRGGVSLALSHQRVAVKRRDRRGPVKAVSRRSRARKARALTGVGWSGSVIPNADRSAHQVRSVSAAHCTDFLSAKENPDSCNVRRCQKNCDKLLHYLTIDRRAPWSLYPAIKRSMVCASPILRHPSPSRHRTNTRTSRTRAGCARIWRSWISGSLSTADAAHGEDRTQELSRLRRW